MSEEPQVYYCKFTDSPRRVAETIEIGKGAMFVDVDNDGESIGVEFLHPLDHEDIALLSSAPALLAACEAIKDWYDRDGSVGGIVEPMDQLTAAIEAAKQ